MRRRHALESFWCALVATAALAPAMPAVAQPTLDQRLLFQPQLSTDRKPTFDAPLSLGVTELKAAEPVWTAAGVWATRPTKLWGLARAHQAGAPAWDPTTNAWYAFADGMLVRVDPDGSLPVILEELQGKDVDVRAARGLAVSRDPNKDEIVLHRLNGEPSRQVLLRGPQYFNPRFSPDGSRILVSESRARGGHVWLVTPEGAARDLGQGYFPSWHPDGQRVVFARVEHDGYTLRASSLFLKNLATGAERLIAKTRAPVATRTAVSPDGSWVAFADASGAEVFLAVLPAAQERR